MYHRLSEIVGTSSCFTKIHQKLKVGLKNLRKAGARKSFHEQPSIWRIKQRQDGDLVTGKGKSKELQFLEKAPDCQLVVNVAAACSLRFKYVKEHSNLARWILGKSVQGILTGRNHNFPYFIRVFFCLFSPIYKLFICFSDTVNKHLYLHA